MKFILPGLLLLLSIASCKTGSVFGKKSPHEQYGDKLTQAGLQNATIGRLWFNAAEEALSKPLTVTIPFRQVGYFSADRPLAVGLRFDAKRGQKLQFNIVKNPLRGFVLYGEVWKLESGVFKLHLSADTSENSFEYEVEEAGSYLFRLQPELLQSGEYEISISIGPSLGFPVAGNAKIGSLWGAPRDGGARSHEGIDIFAPRRTPVVATSDGVVSRVTENNIGGKVLFLRPEGTSMSVYYAHLDEQLVQSGQKVKRGDTLGLVGNTGNARTTPPHLHFGIYTSGGAIDPIDFVDPVIKKPKLLNVTGEELDHVFRIVADTKTGSVTVKKNTPVKPFARSTSGDWILLPDGSKISVSSAVLTRSDKPIATRILTDSAFVFQEPSPSSPRKIMLKKNTRIETIGTYGEFEMIRTDSIRGWILKGTR